MNRTVIALVVGLVAAPALAIVPTGTTPPSPAAQSSAAAKAKGQEKKTSFVPQDPKADAGLRRGAVQKVDAARGTFEVYGRTVSFDPARVRVIGADGKPAPLSALKAGANVRFMMDPADPSRGRASVIYLQ